jgi:hypothetical protein
MKENEIPTFEKNELNKIDIQIEKPTDIQLCTSEPSIVDMEDCVYVYVPLSEEQAQVLGLEKFNSPCLRLSYDKK